MAAAEIVERDADAQGTDHFERHGDLGGVAHEHCFSDLDVEAPWIEARFLQRRRIVTATSLSSNCTGDTLTARGDRCGQYVTMCDFEIRKPCSPLVVWQTRPVVSDWQMKPSS